MLLRFCFSNFRSFRDEQELSLIATAKAGPGDFLLTSPGIKESVLPVCAIYGANASGKSNVLKALKFVEEAVLESHRLWEPGGGVPLQAFKGASPEQGAEFVVDFVLAESRYQFGFRATRLEIVEEWLYAFPNGRRQTLYSRGPVEIAFGRNLTGDNKTIASLMRKNSLFLSVAAQNNHEALGPVYDWFRNSVHVVFARSKYEQHYTTQLCSDDARLAEILELMKVADIGVESLSVEKAGNPYQIALEALPAGVSEKMKAEFVVPLGTLRLHHRLQNMHVTFNLEEESAGTVAYFSLLGPILRALQEGSVLAIDEIDASLHPTLAAFIVKLFQDPRGNRKGAQLIFSTHDTNLLSEGVLRKDEVWFAEKDRKGVSRLFPLTDFRLRTGEDFQKRYLTGRFGGVPFIASERLFETLNEESK